jgi:signal transduction histidine kinase
MSAGVRHSTCSRCFSVGTPVLRAYETERRRLFRRRMLVACLLAGGLVPLFGVTDYFMYREEFAPLMGARLLSLLASAAIWVLVRTRLGRRYAPALGLALTFEVGLAIAVVPVYINGVDTPHYVSASLVLLSTAAMLPWLAAEVVVGAVALAATFVTAAVLHGGVLSPTAAFMTQVSAILVTGAIALVIAALSEAGRRREFLARRALHASSKEKTRLIEDLSEKKGELERLNQEMEDLLYISSHDLRAPLINVQGFANEVGRGIDELAPYVRDASEAMALRADIQESLRFIHTAVARMDALIGGLLNVSRVATRTHPGEDVCLRSIAEKTVEAFHYQLEQRGITVRLGPLPVVKGDAVRLNQVFSNLVDNAIKYMGESARREIEIGTRNGRGVPTFFVKDTGPGIPADSLETVFRLFRRLPSSVPGEGLGLAMVRKIVEKHGGRIWVESSPGAGSTFCFTLGVAPGSSPSA